MRLTAALVLTALTLGAAAPAMAEAPGVACDISAMLEDPDPNGTNVRAAPSTGSRVLRVIPVNDAAVASIRGQRGTWFRVASITDEVEGEALFRGDGWVHSSLLGLRVANGDTRLFAAPNRRSRVLRTLEAEETPITLIGCSGQWAKVRAEGREGWLAPSGQCSNPLTTCA
jgi:SH3-like domain-containing protein